MSLLPVGSTEYYILGKEKRFSSMSFCFSLTVLVWKSDNVCEICVYKLEKSIIIQKQLFDIIQHKYFWLATVGHSTLLSNIKQYQAIKRYNIVFMMFIFVHI